MNINEPSRTRFLRAKTTRKLRTAEEENMTRSLEDLNHVTNYAPRKKRLNHP